MTDTKPATERDPDLLQVVLKQTPDFAPRTRKGTSDALVALKPSLEAVHSNPDKVYTIAEGVTPAKAASLVNLLNGRHDLRWTFGGRSTDDGTAIVQARYSERPENARKVRTMKPRKPKTEGKGKGGR